MEVETDGRWCEMEMERETSPGLLAASSLAEYSRYMLSPKEIKGSSD